MPSLLQDLPSSPIDPATVERRVAPLRGRDLDGEARAKALRLLASLLDLTTLEATDTDAKVEALCRRALLPDPARPEIGPVAAVCVYPSLVSGAKAALEGSGVKLASVAGAFPSGLSPLEVKVLEIRRAIEMGASEIDAVLLRGAMLEGDEARVYEELVALREACGEVTLKVILETGELRDLSLIQRASRIAMLAGADFIKTSTGKVSPGASLEAALVMADAIRDFERETGKRVGLKVAGGIRKAEDALTYLALVEEVLGEAWLSPSLFRIGASSLLDDIVRALRACS